MLSRLIYIAELVAMLLDVLIVQRERWSRMIGTKMENGAVHDEASRSTFVQRSYEKTQICQFQQCFVPHYNSHEVRDEISRAKSFSFAETYQFSIRKADRVLRATPRNERKAKTINFGIKKRSLQQTQDNLWQYVASFALMKYICFAGTHPQIVGCEVSIS